ncbi:MAG: amidase family protein [Chloroflexi bacterium]|nr:amidase family protein [Chloroflexota bacterium]
MSEFAFMTALELRDRIARRDISPVELVESSLERMDGMEAALNCFVQTSPDLALEAARQAEEAVMSGEALGLLHGLPVSVKDLIAVDGLKLTFGSRATADNVAAVDAPSVDRVRRQGACIVGKSTTSEFGCKAVGDSPLTGVTPNAWNLAKTPGGSSCGAATSVAAGITPFALGTDGGGSVRIPSSFSGLFGIKAQFARVAVFPASATPTLAHVGPLARTVRDGALLLSAIAGHDRRDPFGVAQPVPDFLDACERPVEGMRLAWSPTLGYARPTDEVVEIVEDAVRVFETLGCIVERVDKVMDDDPLPLWMAEFFAGVGTRLKDVLANSPDLLDPAVAEVLSGALDQDIGDYYAKVFLRYDFREKMRAFFEDYDLLLTPTLPVPAFDVQCNVPPELPDRNIVSWVSYTYPFNLTGQPAASIPAGWTRDGLPVGMQMVSKILHEEDIFRAAAAFEAARPWADRRPEAATGA